MRFIFDVLLRSHSSHMCINLRNIVPHCFAGSNFNAFNYTCSPVHFERVSEKYMDCPRPEKCLGDAVPPARPAI